MNPVIDTSEYTVSVEDVLGRRMIHCDVHVPWSRAVLKRLTKDADEWHDSIGTPVFALHYESQDSTHLTFLRLFGFKLIQAGIMMADGELADLYYRFPKKVTDGKENRDQDHNGAVRA